jgi:predicted PurR-regulated permease PerM
MDGEFKKRTSFVVAVCLGSSLLAMLLWIGREIFLVLFAGLIGALLLTTMTDWIRRRFRLPRNVAFSLALVSIVGFLGLAIWMRGAAIVQQFSALQVDLPAAMQQVLARMRTQGWGRWILAQYAGQDLSKGVSYLISKIGGVVATTASTVVGFFVVVAVSLYVAAEPAPYLSILYRLTPAAYRTKLDMCLAGAIHLLRSWLLAKLISMISIGVFIALGLWALNVPLAGTLAVIAALLTFVPNLGPVISVLPAAALAFAISPTTGILTLLLFGVAHFLEGNIVTPLLERKIVTLPPALTLATQLLVGLTCGAIGVVLAAPLTAALLGILYAIQAEKEPSLPNALQTTSAGVESF